MIHLVFNPFELQRNTTKHYQLLITVLDIFGIEYSVIEDINFLKSNIPVITDCFVMETPWGNKGHEIGQQIIDRVDKVIFYYPNEANFTYSSSFGPTAEYAQGKSEVHLIKNGSAVVTGYKSVHNLYSYFAWNTVHRTFNFARAKYTENLIDTSAKHKKFLFLNGEDRGARTQLFEIIEQKQLLDKSVWSNLKGKSDSGTRPLSDWSNPFCHMDFRFAAFFPKHYYSTEFSLVTETSTDEFYPTEKIFKPILLGHPFIVSANAGFLSKMKSLGFKTYETVFDESYDTVDDINKRLYTIAESVETACKLDNILDLTYNERKYNIARLLDFSNTAFLDLLTVLQEIVVDATITENVAVSGNLLKKYFL